MESFLVYPDVVRKFIKGTLTQTNGNNIEISGSEYRVLYRTDTMTDRWTYSYSNHQVTSIHSSETGANRFEMQYDASGNMVSQRDYKKSLYKDMVYDSYNRIREVTNPDTGDLIGQYYYDDQGFRVRRIAQYEEGEQTRYVELNYLSKYFAIEIRKNSTGKISQRCSSSVNNIYLNGVRIAALDHEGRTRYFLTDQVDSVKVIADDAGNIVSRFEYMPYGEVFVREGEAKYSAKFNSQELNKETNYYFYNARHYDPEIARFVTADSVIDGQLNTVGWNRYTYVRGNPVVYRDPTGHRALLYNEKNIFYSVDGEKNKAYTEQNKLFNPDSNYYRIKAALRAQKKIDSAVIKEKGGNLEKKSTNVIIKWNSNGKYFIFRKNTIFIFN